MVEDEPEWAKKIFREIVGLKTQFGHFHHRVNSLEEKVSNIDVRLSKVEENTSILSQLGELVQNHGSEILDIHEKITELENR